METSSGIVEHKHRWRALRTVSMVFRVLAWVIVGLGGLGVLIGTVSVGASADGGAGEAILTLIFGGIGVGFYALITFAASELIMIGIAIEENTRHTASGLVPGQEAPVDSGLVPKQESPESGWYPDPDDPAQQRYWDGSAWGQTRPTKH